MSESYCCPMRRHFVMGLIGVRAGEPAPVEASDFVVDFTAKPMILRIKFCPFCGARLGADQTVRVPTP